MIASIKLKLRIMLRDVIYGGRWVNVLAFYPPEGDTYYLGIDGKKEDDYTKARHFALDQTGGFLERSCQTGAPKGTRVKGTKMIMVELRNNLLSRLLEWVTR